MTNDHVLSFCLIALSISHFILLLRVNRMSKHMQLQDKLLDGMFHLLKLQKQMSVLEKEVEKQSKVGDRGKCDRNERGGAEKVE